jgi:hypothetical protein
MTREEKCELAIERGYTYNSESGIVYSRLNKIVKSKDKDGYLRLSMTIGYKKCATLFLHHFAWYCVYGNCDTEQIDHINGIKNDNRICNLRAVNNMQNQWNRNDMKGYWFRKDRQKYQALIAFNGKKKCIGHFDTEQEARQAYLNAKEKYHII